MTVWVVSPPPKLHVATNFSFTQVQMDTLTNDLALVLALETDTPL